MAGANLIRYAIQDIGRIGTLTRIWITDYVVLSSSSSMRLPNGSLT